MSCFDLLAAATPWLAALLGIGAAGAAQLAFGFADKAGSEKPWQDGAMPDDRAREIDDRAERNRLVIRQAGATFVATCLATGAAIEGAAASQHGIYVCQESRELLH